MKRELHVKLGRETVERVAEKLIQHKITISFTPHEEANLRETSGILESVEKDIVCLKMFDTYGTQQYYYLNRHACTLYSVIDEGEIK